MFLQKCPRQTKGEILSTRTYIYQKKLNERARPWRWSPLFSKQMEPQPELVPLWEGFSYKSHQISGIQWMIERESQENSGGLLCDEMGLGKTMELLGLMKNTALSETLLLCPKAVLEQWRSAAKKAEFNIVEADGVSWKVSGKIRSKSSFLFLTNYDKLLTRPSLFKRVWGRLILDEAHRACNPNGKNYQAIAKITRTSTWVATATPIINARRDIETLFRLIGYSYKETCSFEKLKILMTEACLHRSMEEMRPLLPELPHAAKIEKEELDFLSEDEQEFYQGMQGILLKRWKALDSDNPRARFQLIMRLRQLSTHPQVYIAARKREWPGYNRPDWDVPSTKFAALKHKIESCSKEARWIVFCQFRDEMEILKCYLETSPAIHFLQLYNGGLTDVEKETVLVESRRALVEGKHQILLLQLQSGGVGLNLQHFSKIVFMSPWWTSALMDQAIGRAVRIGQEETVEVTLLLLKEEASMNIDQMMMKKADTKRNILSELFTYSSKGIEPEEAEEAEETEDPK